MEKIVQCPPFTVLVEPTEGCNLGCSFCGLRGMRLRGTTPWFFMTVELAERIASEIARVEWRSKIVFAQHGEPTLNPNFIRIVQTFRSHLPENIFHVYTNGYAINRAKRPEDYLDALFEAGINNVILDCYVENGDWTFVEKIDPVEYNVVHYEKKIPLYAHSRKRRILLLPCIKFDKKITRRVVNHCGAAAPLDDSFNGKRCAMPFRELAFRYDGNVALCCDDFRGEYPIANIWDTDILSLWNSERFQLARIMLYNRNRDFRPCRGCTNRSMRVGFLPDPMGRETLPNITEEVYRKVQEVKEDGPLTKIIVRRRWEK